MRKFFKTVSLLLATTLFSAVSCVSDRGATPSSTNSLTLTSSLTASAIASSTSTPEHQTNQAIDLLSPEQRTQLIRLGIEVVLPTYLPPGFQVSRFTAYQQQNPNDRTDSSFYIVSYRGPNHTCIQTMSYYQAILISNPTQSQLETKLGVLSLLSGHYRNTRIIQYWANPEDDRKNWAVVTGGSIASELCNPVSMTEFTRVLQSLALVSKAAPYN